MPKVRLDKAGNQFIEALEDPTLGLSEGTLILKRRTIREFVDYVGGNTYTRDLKEHDFTGYLKFVSKNPGDEVAAMRVKLNEQRRLKALTPYTGRAANTLEKDKSNLKQFVQWLKRNRMVAQFMDPLAKITSSTKATLVDDIEEVEEKQEAWLRLEEWKLVLEQAAIQHARARALVATGLFSGRRVSELQKMRRRHIDLDHIDPETEKWSPQIAVLNQKSGRYLWLGMVAPLVDEFRNYLDWYTENYGEPKENWYLFPAKIPSQQVWKDRELRKATIENPRLWPVNPLRQANKGDLISEVRDVLVNYGWDPKQRIGVHALRRSHVKVLDQMGMLGIASVGLDHSSIVTTEKHYAGKSAGQKRYDEEMAGKNPFAAMGEDKPKSNVVDFMSRLGNRAG